MVYTALLNCYAREKDVEKAEATFKKLTNTGVMRSPLVFNILMHLYFQTADSDNEGMDKILEKMESNGEVFPDWNAYCVAADGCLKAGIMEMAMTMLKKLEEKTKSVAFDTLLKSYARKGNKDELYRIWKPDEKRDKIYNKEKAESLIDQAMMKGSEPSADAWYSLARKGDQNKAEEFIELLRSENIFSPVAHSRLLTYIKGLKSQSDGLLYDSVEWWRNRVNGDSPMADEVASGVLP
nr:pentatricopeptide repeat-containing protein At2g20710, mitochondrial-like [Populus alba]